MAEQFVFTFNGAYFKAIVNAYRQIADSFVFHFTREDVTTCVLGTDGSRAIQIILTPFDYRAYQDEAWVDGGMDLLWGAVKKLKKADTVKVRVEDDKLYVGTIRVGEVLPEGEVFDTDKIEPPAVGELGFIQVIATGFKRILRSAPPDTQFIGFDIDAPGGHIVLGDSIVDLGEPHEWLLAVSGKAREAYTLNLFIPLLVSGLIEDAYIRITEKGPAIIEYAEAQSTVRLYMAPVTGGAEMIAGIVEKPKPVRTLLLRMGKESAVLFKAVKAIDYLTEYEDVTFDTADGLGLFWQVGYLKVPPPYLETWIPPPEPFQGDFRLADLAKHLKGVVDLRLYYDAEKRLVLWGTGPTIAPWELTANSVPVKVEVPKVEGKIIFTGPADLLLRTVDDAKAAEDNYLVFYTTPYEIEAFGRNAVYYEATFELDDFQAVEEDYIPINEEAFGYLIGFFKNVPAPWCSVGKTPDDHVYLSCETHIGEFRAIRTQYYLKEAIEAYEERVKRPVAPPEAEKLPAAPPPKLLDPTKPEVAEIRSLTRAPFRFVILNDGEIRIASMGKFLSKEELEARPELLKEAQGYFLEELETLGIKPPALELVTVYPSTHINQFTGVDTKLYGPYEAGEAALIPRENAEIFVREHFASWEKLPPKPPEIPPPPAVRTYAELEKEFEEKDPWDALAIFVSRFEGFKRDYSTEDLHLFLRELRERTSTESVYRFYKIYPQLRDDFMSIASRIGWIPPEPPAPAPPKPRPPKRPPPARLRPEEVEEVWEQFVAWAKLAEIVEPLAYRDRFVETIRTSPTVANAVERARRLVSRITTELKPAPPTAPPGPPLVPVPDVAEVYRRLGVPPGASVSEAAFQAVWQAIQRERAVGPPKGLIRSELDYLWREFADFLKKFDRDPERHRPEFDEVINPDFNLVENLDTVMKRAHELTDSERWGPERWR